MVAVTGAVTCPACTAACPAEARFCAACGAALTAPAARAVERKVVSTLFCDIVGHTARCEQLDPEDVDELLRAFYSLAREVIETYGGLVEKFVGDAVVGVFGVPAVHEDDAERAVITALRLRDRVAALPEGRTLQVRIGVNTGTSVVRLDAVSGSGAGFLVGDAINTAARLQQLAPPMGVLVGATTHDLTDQRIVYEALPPARVKGRRGPPALWLAQRPVSRMGVDLRREYPAALVDREVELGILGRLLEKVGASGRSQLALIVGEAGIGKSRLLFEFLRHVDSRPQIVRWRQGRCPAYGDGVAFWALGEMVREQLGVRELDDAVTIEARLAQALAGEGEREWLAARLRPLLGLEAPSASREENFAAWRRFLEMVAADSPAVLAFEDLHWASAGTVEFLTYLVETLGDAPLLLVGTARPEFFNDHPEIAHLVAESGSRRVVRIDLAPLTESETEELVTRLGSDLTGLAETRRTITRLAAGNALYVEQLIRHVAAEVLDAGRTDVVLKERAPEALPESLQMLIAARLDVLPPARKSLLGDAAVVGEVFWTGALAALDHGDRTAAEEGLADLARRDLVRPESSSSIAGEREYVFRHGLIRDVAYGQLTRADRAAKHAAVARWVEATAGDRVDEVAEILAHHYTTALALARATGDATRERDLLEPTIEALKLAGNHALPLDVAAGERHYAKAVELAGDSPRRPHLLVAWAKALEQSGRLEEAVSAFDEGARSLRASGDGRTARLVSARSWYAHWLLADGQMMSSDEAATLARDDEASPELIGALEDWMNRAVHVGQNTEAIELAERVVELTHLLQLPESPSAVMCRGMARCALGEAAGLGDLEHALQLARARGIGHTVRATLSNFGEFLALFEGPDAARRVHQEGLELARQHRDGLAVCFCREALVVDEVWAGRWEVALTEADDLDRLLVAHKDMWDLQVLRSTIGLVGAWRGDVDQAREQAEWAEERSRTSPLVAIRGACLVSLASVEVCRGNKGAALELLGACRPLSPAACVPDFALRVPEAVRLAIGLGEPRLARELAAHLPASRPFDAGTLAMLDALLRAHSGDHVGAAAQFSVAAAQRAGLGVPYEQATALLGRGGGVCSSCKRRATPRRR